MFTWWQLNLIAVKLPLKKLTAFQEPSLTMQTLRSPRVFTCPHRARLRRREQHYIKQWGDIIKVMIKLPCGTKIILPRGAHSPAENITALLLMTNFWWFFSSKNRKYCCLNMKVGRMKTRMCRAGCYRSSEWTGIYVHLIGRSMGSAKVKCRVGCSVGRAERWPWEDRRYDQEGHLKISGLRKHVWYSDEGRVNSFQGDLPQSGEEHLSPELVLVNSWAHGSSRCLGWVPPGSPLHSYLFFFLIF